jgi:hypothetical protein
MFSILLVIKSWPANFLDFNLWIILAISFGETCLVGRDIESGVSRKLLILTNCELLGIISRYGIKILERYSPKRLALSRSDSTCDPSNFLIGQEYSFNFSILLVVFDNDL